MTDVTFTEENGDANARRLALAARQLLTANRAERHLCSVVLADVWSSTAPLCPEPATRYIDFDDYRTGSLTEGVFYPAETTTRLCDGHDAQARRMPGWRWSRPLSEVSKS